MLSRKLPNLGKAILVRLFSTKAKPASSKYTVTTLHNLHLEQGGKMVNFANFLLPVQYDKHGICESHMHTREKASLFDVSHMLQTEILGECSVQFFEKLCTADLQKLPEKTSVLTVFTNDKGGILDDLIVTKISNDHLYIVSNATRRGQDQKLILSALDNYKKENKNSKIYVRFFEAAERSLLALQGPKAAEILQELTDIDLSELYFMHSEKATVASTGACRITRCGYTGEDGFEISIPGFKSYDVASEILKNQCVKMAGLGARDSLRLEAGLCLYGCDMSDETSPVEAGLTWLVAKGRRERCDFPGADVILRQIKDGTCCKRVGIMYAEGPPARRDTPIFVGDAQQQVGLVSSGCPSPSLGKNIAMGYVYTEHSKVGTNLQLKIRDKMYCAEVTKMPFISTKYYTKSKC